MEDGNHGRLANGFAGDIKRAAIRAAAAPNGTRHRYPGNKEENPHGVDCRGAAASKRRTF